MAPTETEQEQTSLDTRSTAQNVELEEVQDIAGESGEANLDILLDVNMPVTVNLGKTEVPFRRLLQLGPGSVLELDKQIGQPAELYVQDVKFATGDIVVVDGFFAVRMKEVLGMDSGSEATEE
jgi:flagellar motor switch protein FliN